MKKVSVLLLSSLSLLFPLAAADTAAPAARVRIDLAPAGNSAVVCNNLTVQPGGSIIPVAWGPEAARKYKKLAQSPVLDGNWREVTFRFTPNADGRIVCYLRANDFQNAAKQREELWVRIDDVSVTGLARPVKNGDFESVEAGRPKGWDLRGAKLLAGGDAKGGNCLEVDYNHPAVLLLNVVRNQPVTLRCLARFSRHQPAAAPTAKP